MLIVDYDFQTSRLQTNKTNHLSKSMEDSIRNTR